MSICLVTDLHLGRDPHSSWAEPVCATPAEELVQRLKHVLIANGVERLVLGGDMIEHGDAQQIDRLVDLFRPLYVPTLVCLGNHDLAASDAMAHWRESIQRWPQATLADACVDAGPMQVIGLNTRWISPDHETRETWTPGTPCLPALPEPQRRWLRLAFEQITRPTVLCLHAPLHTTAVGERRDGAVAYHTFSYRNALEAELARAARGHFVKAIVSGHVHFASVARSAERLLITNSAVSESPACVRILRWVDQTLQVQNVALASDDTPP